MKKLSTLILAVACFTASAQTEYPYPYNPDGNNDGFVSLNDLLDLLAIFGSEYYSGVLATDSISAIMYTGQMDYWDCTSSCIALTGNWKVLDHFLVGSYRNEIVQGSAQSWWLDHKVFEGSENSQFFHLTHFGDSAEIRIEPILPFSHSHCYCQTRTRGDIEDLNLCENELDECGVCGGDGAVYDCGCESIPEGDCDCDGNQVDAVGVCGGDCLEDLDGDGVCDPVLGPCEGEDFVSYHGVDYPIIETADGRCWFAEDLASGVYRNGEPISLAQNVLDWPSTFIVDSQYELWLCCIADMSATYAIPISYQGASCGGCGWPWSSYSGDGYDASSHENSGFLYNWGAVNSGMLCPTGFHVPSSTEWQSLLGSVAGNLEDSYISLLPPTYAEDYPCDIEYAPIPTLDYGSSGMQLASYSSLNSFGYYKNTNDAMYWTSDASSQNHGEHDAQVFYVSVCGDSFGGGISSRSMDRGNNVRCIKDTE